MNSLRKIALVGGDEFRPGCEEMDRAILAATGAARPSVVVVPTAAAAQWPDRAASNGVAYFNSLGAQAEPLMVLNETDANDAGLVFWPGGVFVAAVMTWSPRGVGVSSDVLAGNVARLALQHLRG